MSCRFNFWSWTYLYFSLDQYLRQTTRGKFHSRYSWSPNSLRFFLVWTLWHHLFHPLGKPLHELGLIRALMHLKDASVMILQGVTIGIISICGWVYVQHQCSQLTDRFELKVVSAIPPFWKWFLQNLIYHPPSPLHCPLEKLWWQAMGLICQPPWLCSPVTLYIPTCHESLKCHGSKIFPC